jgi:GH15 family glucan-1,4-alpha-glucosidase
MTGNRVEDYAVIGDCETAALVGRDGSIDWLCWPRFDSDACFAAVLGDERNGRWKIAPKGAITRQSRTYRGDTLILETRFETDEGAVTLIDFMPPRGKASDMCRIVVGESGRVAMSMELIMRCSYGAIVPWVTRMEDGSLRLVAGPDRAVLRASVDFRGEDLKTVADFTVAKGDRIPFVLTYSTSFAELPAEIDADAALADTEKFWTKWSARYRESVRESDAPKAWTDLIMRSLIALKALTHGPTGGIVAAVTCSLPETLGGGNNWDYRYCWIRDATLSLLALMNAGYFEEAQAWRDWLLRAAAGDPGQMQIMYGVGGERRLLEWTADWLPGYAQSRPVRIGNAAHSQLQLDVCGELMDALHQARCGGLPESDPAWALQRVMIDHLDTIWMKPDQGIWEMREPPRHHTYSKVMCWVAFDRAIKSVELFKLDGPVDRWRAVREAIHADVCAKGYDASLGCFVESYGSKQLDASLLLLPSVGFLPADDPRMVGTIEAVEKRLYVKGFVFRHDAENAADIPKREGAFLACSFWLVDAWAMIGRTQDARRLYERLLAIVNDVGLLAEEYDTEANCQVGNVPQAFSHVALVNSGHNLAHAAKPTEQRSQGPGGAGG